MMKVQNRVQKITVAIAVLSLAACNSAPPKHETFDLINAELAKASQPKSSQVQPEAVAAALLPPIRIEVPKPRQPLEERFNLAFNNVPAAQFFMAIATGTRYSMLVHPEVTGLISANLKDVTIFEALDAIRELYGYDYKVEGTRVYIKPLTLQTRVFQVNYLTGSRRGSSDIRVSSGSIGDSAPGTNTLANPTGTGQPNNPTTPGNTANTLNTSKISTTSNSDFWGELKASLEGIVGNNKDGRSVVISPQSGVVMVRAMWDELRNVESYLRATQLSVDRQVILDAKILEVELSDSFQSGVNWASFASFAGNTSNRVAAGFVSPGATLSPLPFAGGKPDPLTGGNVNAVNATTGFALGAPAGAAGSLFGLAFQTSNFAALISFLETQGNVQVLSSPRISTLNNQKAVLKVGRDEFFVTSVSSTTTTGTATTTTPNVTLQPFFSGVSLDVTPQIDESGNIILHIHPSVVNVTTVEKNINLGAGGSLILPLASSTVSETDSVVRGQDGQVVAIGGLMRQAAVSDRSQIPGAGDAPVVGGLFRNTGRSMQKRELVILLKPMIVQGNASWSQDVNDSQQRIQGMQPQSRNGMQQ
jgi:MSHA biogenesis protein MshL